MRGPEQHSPPRRESASSPPPMRPRLLDRWLLALALIAFGATCVHTNERLRKLESRLDRLRDVEVGRPASGQTVYRFDDTFVRYFGPRGVEEVERALRILDARPERPPTSGPEARPLRIREPDASWTEPGFDRL